MTKYLKNAVVAVSSSLPFDFFPCAGEGRPAQRKLMSREPRGVWLLENPSMHLFEACLCHVSTRYWLLRNTSVPLRPNFTLLQTDSIRIGVKVRWQPP